MNIAKIAFFINLLAFGLNLFNYVTLGNKGILPLVALNAFCMFIVVERAFPSKEENDERHN
jgi:hypothetical protein